MNEIILLPVRFYDKSLLEYLKSSITKIIDHPVSISKNEINMDEYYNPERGQYDAAKIINYVEQETSALTIICTSEDLFIPIFTYVFGLAKLKGHAAIVSTHRLKNSFYGLHNDPERLEERMLKEVIHEIGHLAGLRHCTQPQCVMASSTSADDLDIKNADYCKICLKKMIEIVGKDNRYILHFLKKVDTSQ